jgi:hypothetical protein
VSEANAREIIVETTKVKAVFSNRGGKIVHWILKEFRSDKGEPLDLVPGGAGADAIKPFTLTVDDQAMSSAHQRCDLSRHRRRQSRGRDGRCDRVAEDDRLRSRVRRRLERQEDLPRRADELHRHVRRRCEMGGSA